MMHLQDCLQRGNVYVIAEAGVNHNGDSAVASKLIDAAAACGVDAVKFQLFDPTELASVHAPKAEYQKQGSTGGSQVEMLQSLTLPKEAYITLAKRAGLQGIDFIVTPFDAASARFLVEIGIDALKIPSGEITNLPFLESVAALQKFTIISTGMSILEEVESAVRPFKSANTPYALLHCVSSYPAPFEQINLRAIELLRTHFSVPVGYSDHTEGTAVALAAAALGAGIIEKHFTLDRTLPGPDHAASLEPEELARMVRDIRIVERALGKREKRCQPCEENVRDVARRSLILSRSLKAGQSIAREDIIIQRPGTGITPSALSSVIGKILKRDLQAGVILQHTDFQ